GGYGYSPAEDRKSTTLGQIPMDAVFSPVIRVNFAVESTRVGRLTNYDRLVLDIITDGTVIAGDAVVQAAQTLVNYFQAIVTPQTGTPTAAASANSRSSGSSISVEELDLPTRISNALQKAGFETVADLVKVPKAELAKVKNVGVKSVKIIEIALKERGIDLPQ
ncbi:MAG: DNA-directed RNA polymerase subunit alpha C-terminal domain-containing protein, partial [bacterium]|nr:DNA-directed RNA polymerase subunit alpha C-terminal domain-containing protein [bacterium]